MTISDFVTVEWAPASDPTSTTPTWVDITSIVMSVEVSGGRSGVFDLYGPRTATIRCRNGTKSPAVSPTFDIQGFYKWRQIRVFTPAVFDTAVFAGFILSVTHDQTNSPYHGEVIIECADVLGVFSRAEFNQTAGATVNGVSSAVTLTEALTAALANAGLSTPNEASGGSTAYFKYPDAEDGESAPTGNVLKWLQDVLEAENGGIQAQADGTLIVNGRWRPFATAANSPFVTFSDTPTGGEFEYLRENLTFAGTDTDYYNRAVAKSSEWPTTFEADNVPAGYPTETLSRTDLPFVYQSWAEANAALYVGLYAQTVTYPRTLSVYFASFNEAAPLLAAFIAGAGYAFGADHIAIKHTPVGDTQQTYHVTVENVRHSISPTIWKCELGFASLDRWIDAYGDGSDIYELVQIDGDAGHGIDSPINAIIAP